MYFWSEVIVGCMTLVVLGDAYLMSSELQITRVLVSGDLLVIVVLVSSELQVTCLGIL